MNTETKTPRPPTYVHAHGVRGWIIPLAEHVSLRLDHDGDGEWSGRVLFQNEGHGVAWPIEAELTEGDAIALARHYNIDVDQPKPTSGQGDG